ncbi:hypothetical protein FB45DRAFT_1036981 [Roridomyces roridus]|uniref:Uncharacterized protein n=1 Tax=Roridomyces roridus TaxID=1738132 RepID=A0AAD7B896_9AGAR|nr:hypothetical protein FB45DRAFT_1036981 [Roridomyces roridus]
MNLFFRIFGSPYAVVLGQTALLVFAWGFFGIMNPRPVTLFVTLVSTALAKGSTFLFACGLQYAVTLHLYSVRGMLLSKFTSTVALSAGSFINDTRRWKWALASVVFIFLTGVQVSAWNTFLTPTQIFIQVFVTGRELDLANPELRTYQASGELDFCIGKSSMLPAFGVGLTDSGFALLKFRVLKIYF